MSVEGFNDAVILIQNRSPQLCSADINSDGMHVICPLSSDCISQERQCAKI